MAICATNGAAGSRAAAVAAHQLAEHGTEGGVIYRGLQHRLLTIPLVDSLTLPLTLPLSKGARQERWEKQRMIERAEEGQEDSRNINPQFSQPLLPPFRTQCGQGPVFHSSGQNVK